MHSHSAIHISMKLTSFYCYLFPLLVSRSRTRWRSPAAGDTEGNSWI